MANQYLPLEYHFALDVNHTKPNFTGVATIDLIANPQYAGTIDGPFSLTLHGERLVVTKAILNDAIPLKVTYQRDQREIHISAPEHVNQPRTVTLSYMGQIKQINTYEDQTLGLFKTNYLDSVLGKSNNYILATHFQPHAAKLVFPVIEELLIKVPISLEISTLGKFKVMLVGELVSLTPVLMLENNVFKFKKTPPMAMSVFGFVIGDLECLEEVVGHTTMRVYSAIGELKHTRLALQYTTSFMALLEKLFHVKYPLDKLDFVGLPFLSDGAMENWGLVTVMNQQVMLPLDAPFESRLGLQRLIAHELVHQWMGNLVTFDNWNQLWFNESFASWVGDFVVDASGINRDEVDYAPLIQSTDALQALMQRDCRYGDIGELQLPSITHFMQLVNTGFNCMTTTLFEETVYEKGMAIIGMVQQMFAVENADFFAAVGEFIKENQFKLVKVFELWRHLNDKVSVDLLVFTHSWSNAVGVPLVTVSIDNGKVKAEQHRFLFRQSAKELGLEDTPYQIPLSIKVLQDDGNTNVIDILVSDRLKNLGLNANQVLVVNSGSKGYFRTHYPKEMVQNMAENISKLDLSDLLDVFHDYGAFFEDVEAQVTSDDVVGFLTLVDLLALPEYHLDYTVVRAALMYLDNLNDGLRHFSDYTKFGEWMEQFQKKMFTKMGHWDQLPLNMQNLSALELQSRNSILVLGIDNPHCQAIGKTLFKNFIHSGKTKKFTLRYVVAAMLNLTLSTATAREYKDVLELVKNSDINNLSNLDMSIAELQTMAILCLAFTSDPLLLHKTLNFVGTNVDSKLIELGLLGFRYKTDKQQKLQLFNWYKVNYDKWAAKSLRPGSDWAAQLKITLANMNALILGTIMQHDPELVKLGQQFIEDKVANLPEHGLQQTISQVDNRQKVAMGELYAEIVAQL